MTYTLPNNHTLTSYSHEEKNIYTVLSNQNIQQKLISTSLKSKHPTYSQFQYIQKRALDFIFSFILFLITLPVGLYTMYRIKKESPGSIFFKQSRIGLNGKKFTCYKFRSMHHHSAFNPYTHESDDRVFPFGKIMRKMRIDELPQLLNVLKGEMHLIGPRAEWDILVEKYENIIPSYHARHSVAPGITGLAQVLYPYGCNTQDARNKLRYDKLYIRSWSLKLELQIVWRTITVILHRKGQ